MAFFNSAQGKYPYAVRGPRKTGIFDARGIAVLTRRLGIRGIFTPLAPSEKRINASLAPLASFHSKKTVAPRSLPAPYVRSPRHTSAPHAPSVLTNLTARSLTPPRGPSPPLPSPSRPPPSPPPRRPPSRASTPPPRLRASGSPPANSNRPRPCRRPCPSRPGPFPPGADRVPTRCRPERRADPRSGARRNRGGAATRSRGARARGSRENARGAEEATAATPARAPGTNESIRSRTNTLRRASAIAIAIRRSGWFGAATAVRSDSGRAREPSRRALRPPPRDPPRVPAPFFFSPLRFLPPGGSTPRRSPHTPRLR